MLDEIYITVKPEDINYVNRIIEGYEHLGMVSTINRAEGKLIIRVTPDTYDDVMKILSNLSISIIFE